MISFNKDLNLALNFLNLLTDKRQRSADLSKVLGISDINLRRITTKLSKASLVDGSTGKGGGFKTTGNLISLYEVMIALYGNPLIDKSKFSGLIHHKYIRSLQHINIFTRSITIKSESEEITPILTPNKIEEIIDEIIEETEDEPFNEDGW